MTHTIAKERVGALSDGVIAIAATILVLQLQIPDDGSLPSGVVLQWAGILTGWAISFAMVALVWFDSHFHYEHSTRWNSPLMALSFIQLAAVSLIPFASNLIIDFPRSLAAAVAFTSVMLANGLVSVAISMVLVRHVDLHTHSGVAAIIRRRACHQSVIYGLTAALALAGAVVHHPFLGVALWALSPVMVYASLLVRKAELVPNLGEPA